MSGLPYSRLGSTNWVIYRATHWDKRLPLNWVLVLSMASMMTSKSNMLIGLVVMTMAGKEVRLLGVVQAYMEDCM